MLRREIEIIRKAIDAKEERLKKRLGTLHDDPASVLEFELLYDDAKETIMSEKAFLAKFVLKLL